MLREVGRGLAAGAAGTLALEATTFLDMLVRGRPPSELPARAAGKLADGAGVDLGPEDTGVAANRRNALGSLLGHLTGLSVGAAYGIVRGRRSATTAWPLTGLMIGLAAMAAGGVPATLSGLTDPRKWGVSGWLEDLVPHVGYGLAAALAYEALTDQRR
ncbi:MAG: hypothetical protein ACRDYA_15315 [Egibacteraceae bacterium]